MHHRKSGFGPGKKRRGHGKHGGHHHGIGNLKSHKGQGRRHAYHTNHGDLGDHGDPGDHRDGHRIHRKVLDFHGRKQPHSLGTGAGHSRNRSDAKADVNLEKCVLCGKCMKVCPTEAIVVNEESIRIDTDQCIGCGHCVERCKKGALFLVEGKEAVTN